MAHVTVSFEIPLQRGKHILPAFAKDDTRAHTALAAIRAYKGKDDDRKVALLQAYDKAIAAAVKREMRPFYASDFTFEGDGRESYYSLFVTCSVAEKHVGALTRMFGQLEVIPEED